MKHPFLSSGDEWDDDDDGGGDDYDMIMTMSVKMAYIYHIGNVMNSRRGNALSSSYSGYVITFWVQLISKLPMLPIIKSQVAIQRHSYDQADGTDIAFSSISQFTNIYDCKSNYSNRRWQSLPTTDNKNKIKNEKFKILYDEPLLWRIDSL